MALALGGVVRIKGKHGRGYCAADRTSGFLEVLRVSEYVTQERWHMDVIVTTFL
jgi:hypothetical protein